MWSEQPPIYHAEHIALDKKLTQLRHQKCCRYTVLGIPKKKHRTMIL